MPTYSGQQPQRPSTSAPRISMREAACKSLDRPEETRPFEKGKVDVVTLGDVKVGRAVFQPGWKWSLHVKPIAHTDLCEADHTGYCVAGRMMVKMDNGDAYDLKAGDAFVIPPGHDAWVVGDEPCVVLDFTGFGEYAKSS